jgi:hypothetical protein
MGAVIVIEKTGFGPQEITGFTEVFASLFFRGLFFNDIPAG